MSCVLSAWNASPGCCKNSRARFFAPDPISYGRANCKMDEVSFLEKAAFRILNTGKPYLLYLSVIRRARIRDAPGSSCSYKTFTRGRDHLKRRSSRPRFPRLLGCAVRNQKSFDYPCRVRHRRRGAEKSQAPLHKIITYSPPSRRNGAGDGGKVLYEREDQGAPPCKQRLNCVKVNAVTLNLSTGRLDIRRKSCYNIGRESAQRRCPSCSCGR